MNPTNVEGLPGKGSHNSKRDASAECDLLRPPQPVLQNVGAAMLANVRVLQSLIEPMAPDLTDNGSDHRRDPRQSLLREGEGVRRRRNQLRDSSVHFNHPSDQDHYVDDRKEEYLWLDLNPYDVLKDGHHARPTLSFRAGDSNEAFELA